MKMRTSDLFRASRLPRLSQLINLRLSNNSLVKENERLKKQLAAVCDLLLCLCLR
jgi:hypothetical protein